MCARGNVSKRQAVSLFVFEYTSNVSGFQLMAPWNDNTERTIRGLFTNFFAPKRYRGVTGVTMVMGELVWGCGVSGGEKQWQYRQRKPIASCEVYDQRFMIGYLFP